MEAGERHVVLVVHGAANRARSELADEIEGMREHLAPRVVEPVFWGDLGPADAQASFPRADDAFVIDGNDDDAEPIADTAERIEARAGEPVPEATVAVVRGVLDDAAAAGEHVEHPEVHEALADAVVATEPSGTAALADAESNRLLQSVRGSLRRIVHAVDARLDQLSPETLTDHMRHALARVVRDVEAYERHGDAIRERFDTVYRSVRDDAARIDVVAHSLGALVAVDWLSGAPAGAGATTPAERRIDTLVSFGAQVSLVVEVRGLASGDGFVMPPPLPLDVTLPLRRWRNVWHALDPLAFAVAPVLRVTGLDGPVEIDDLRLATGRVPTTAAFHTIYWRDERFLDWLDRSL